ncbi:MAG: DUF1501 domain-containing protein [Planctomycetota bacterium]
MTTPKRLARTLDETSRRAFLARCAAGLLGVRMLPLAGAAMPPHVDVLLPTAGTARRVIYLFMSGGMSHLDTLDPKAEGSAVMGPMKVRASNVDGIALGTHFEHLSRQMDKCCVINSMWSNQGAHSQGRYFVHTGYSMRGTIRHPSLGAWASKLRGAINPTLPPHVAIGGVDAYGPSAGYFESRHAPLPIGDPEDGLANARRPQGVSEEQFRRRLDRLSAMDRAFEESLGGDRQVAAYSEAYDQAVQLMNSRDLLAFDLDQEEDALRDAYGRNEFGQGVLLARRLAEHGVRFIEVTSGGWDTHTDNEERLSDLIPPVDRALAALLADLDARGMLHDTLVVLTSEFGRTPEITRERNGRNHHAKAFSSLLAGGGLRGGVKYGRTDDNGDEVVENKVRVVDFNATIAHALGIPHDFVVNSPSGRPFKVADDGRPILELFA